MTDCYLELNVGGRVYATTRQTIGRHAGVLARTFGPDFSGTTSVVDGAGRPFFPRDANAFAVVLAFLTTGVARVPSGVTREQAHEELAYFLDQPPPVYTAGMLEARALPEFKHLVQCIQEHLAQYLPQLVAIRATNWDGLRVVSYRRVYHDRTEVVMHCVFTAALLWATPANHLQLASQRLMQVANMFYSASNHRAPIADVEEALRLELGAVSVRFRELNIEQDGLQLKRNGFVVIL
jgi:hypothetical protein